MAELREREATLVQHLNEAYGKQQELEAALQAHAGQTTRAAYKKRLKDHVKQSRAQGRGLAKRIKQLGGEAEKVDVPAPDAVRSAAGKAQAGARKAATTARESARALTADGEAARMLGNAKEHFLEEAAAIANYQSIETLAEAVGDRDTAKLARDYRRQEERMSKFLERTIEALSKQVARESVPSGQRNGGGARKGSGAKRGSRAKSASGSSSRAKSASGSTSRAKSASGSRAKASSAKASSGKGSGAKASSSKASTSRRSAGSASAKGSSARGSSARGSSSKGASGGSASKGSGSTARRSTSSRRSS